MGTLRWHRAEAVAAPPATQKVRWHRAAAAGTRPPSTTVRWHGASAAGSALATLAPFAPLVDVEPQDVVSLTAVKFGGSTTPTGWAWRQVSGPAVTLVGTGATRTFTAPSSLTGAVVVLAVAGTIDGVPGPEQRVSVTVVPQLSWIRAAGVANGAWVGSKVIVRAVG